MLNVVFGEKEKYIFDTNMYFNNTYEDDWFDTDFVKEVVKDIDESDVLGA